MSASKYTVRVGADGASKFEGNDLEAAKRFAVEFSQTNWSGQAYVRDNGENIIRYRNGEVEWKHPRRRTETYKVLVETMSKDHPELSWDSYDEKATELGLEVDTEKWFKEIHDQAWCDYSDSASS